MTRTFHIVVVSAELKLPEQEKNACFGTSEECMSAKREKVQFGNVLGGCLSLMLPVQEIYVVMPPSITHFSLNLISLCDPLLDRHVEQKCGARYQLHGIYLRWKADVLDTESCDN